jgi:hypothetical protein
MPTIEELLRGPQKGDVLIPAPNPLERYIGKPEDACAIGYRLAARILVEHTRQLGDDAFLFYPIWFLYRHHVELMLKNLILAFDQPAVRRITQLQELTESARKSLSSGKKAHSLQWLWDLLLPAVRALGEDVVPVEKIEGISFYIRQLNEIDPDSVQLRYTSVIEATKERLRKAQNTNQEASLRTFEEAMERFAGYLDGLDTYLAEIIGWDQTYD